MTDSRSSRREASSAGVLERILAAPPGRVRWIVFAVLALPFVVAAIALAGKHWHPVLDLAMTELRVRDVFTGDTPLIGLPGRINVENGLQGQGSHPGPLSFYLLAPVYRLTGASAYGLLLATIVLNLVAIGVALWIAERRGGTRMVLLVGAVLLVLVHGYGMSVLTQPWNPYLPVLVWFVVLLAAWSVLLGDDAMILVVAAAGSLAAQTHVPYAGLCVGIGALCLGWFVLEAVRHPVRRREVQRWGLLALSLSLLLWVPPIVDQLRNDPGNLSKLSTHFRHPPEPPVGFGDGVRLLLRHLDVLHLLREGIGVNGERGGAFVEAGFRLDGSVLPGLVLLLVWLGGVAVAVRSRHCALLALDAVLGAALVLALTSMARIFGKVWYYLTLWAWPVTVLMCVTIVWTALVWLGGRAKPSVGLRRASAGVAAAVVLAVYVPVTVDGVRADVPEAHLSTTLRALVGPTADALRAGVGAADGEDGRYVVVFSDALYFGSQAYGLVSELRRRGFDVGMADTYRVPITPQRVVDPATATAEIRLATGTFVDEWREVPGAEEVAYVDPRDAGELAEYERLDATLRASLVELGLDDLVAIVDTNLFGVQLDPRLPSHLQAVVDRMLVLGQPEAVFIVPVR